MLGRHELVRRNVSLLRQQSVPPRRIALIVSNDEDAAVAEELGVDVVRSPNQPLGDKFQAGVDFARKCEASHVMINGSDDFLSLEWIRTGLQHLADGHDGVGSRNWMVHDQRTGTTYRIDYTYAFALGCGRMYTAEILDRMDWKLFPSEGSRLDHFSLQALRAVKARLKCMMEDEVFAVSVKGHGAMLNSLERVLSAYKNEIVREELAVELIGPCVATANSHVSGV